MPSNKKLQVFVSSTYLDLKEERQAAVEAILTAGHIPAGMELFAAGDQSQMNVIKRWIDESDVFLLVLGGRYGSIESESGKSYIHLEYEYALSQQKPHFAVVIDEKHLDAKIRKKGRTIVEMDNQANLRRFREQLTTTRLVKFWSDTRDIKLAILETMAEFTRRDDLVGWVPGNQTVDAGALAEELARLTRENAELRKQVLDSQTYNGLRYDEMLRLLAKESVAFVETNHPRDMALVAAVKKKKEANLLEALWVVRRRIIPRMVLSWAEVNTLTVFRRLEFYGIVTANDPDASAEFDEPIWYDVTPDGQKLILRLIFERSGI